MISVSILAHVNISVSFLQYFDINDLKKLNLTLHSLIKHWVFVVDTFQEVT